MVLLLVVPIGVYLLDPTDNDLIFYLFLIPVGFFEIMMVREIIGVIKKNKDKKNNINK